MLVAPDLDKEMRVEADTSEYTDGDQRELITEQMW